MKAASRLIVTALATALAASLSSLAAKPKKAAEPSPPQEKQAAAPAAVAGPHFTSREKVGAAYGEKIFVEYCAVCHGLHGKGDGPRSAFFSQAQYIPDLTVDGFLDGRDQELVTAVREGLARYDEPAIVMPQFKYILGDTEIRSVIAYVKTLTVREKKR